MAWVAGDAFDSLSKVPRLRAPVLVIHGTLDEVIPYRMGRQLFEAIATPKRFVAIDGARHSNIAYVDPQTFWSAIRDFVTDPAAAVVPVLGQTSWAVRKSPVELDANGVEREFIPSSGWIAHDLLYACTAHRPREHAARFRRRRDSSGTNPAAPGMCG
jgi:hypothetical protein